jgi:hypothetical protein
MKKGEQPELSSKWWKASQPKGLKTAGRLEDALKTYESAKRKLEQGGDESAVKAASNALGGIDPAAKAVVSEASKVKNSPEMDATVDALKKFDKLYNTEQSWIEEHGEKEDDSVFRDPDEYHSYLIAAMKKLRSGGQMNFGFVLGKKAEDHRLAVHRSKGSKALANTLVQETGLHAMTFGIAVADENRTGVLVLGLEGRQLPGMKKKGQRMLKKFKPLPFTKLSVIVNGKEVEDLEDPDDTDIDEPDDDNAAEPPPRQAGADGATQVYARSLQTWMDARQKVESEFGKLHGAMTEVYKDHAFGADLDNLFRARVEPVLESLDETLAEKLDELTKTPDPVQRARLVQEARQIIQRYQSFLSNEPLISKLDSNPFVPVTIESTLTQTLSSLQATLS